MGSGHVLQISLCDVHNLLGSLPCIEIDRIGDRILFGQIKKELLTF